MTRHNLAEIYVVRTKTGETPTDSPIAGIILGILAHFTVSNDADRIRQPSSQGCADVLHPFGEKSSLALNGVRGHADRSFGVYEGTDRRRRQGDDGDPFVFDHGIRAESVPAGFAMDSFSER